MPILMLPKLSVLRNRPVEGLEAPPLQESLCVCASPSSHPRTCPCSRLVLSDFMPSSHMWAMQLIHFGQKHVTITMATALGAGDRGMPCAIRPRC